jgi:hypothetical protein
MKLHDLLVLITPNKQLAFQDATTYELAAFFTNPQRISNCLMDTRPVCSRIFAAFREYLDGARILRDVNMNLAIFAVIFALDAHPLLTNHVAAMLNAPSFIVLRSSNLDSNIRDKMVQGY